MIGSVGARSLCHDLISGLGPGLYLGLDPGASGHHPGAEGAEVHDLYFGLFVLPEVISKHNKRLHTDRAICDQRCDESTKFDILCAFVST